MSTASEPEYLSLKHAAAIMGLSVETVRRYANPHRRPPRLATWTPGGRRLTTRAAIDDFLAESTAAKDGLRPASPNLHAADVLRSHGIT